MDVPGQRAASGSGRSLIGANGWGLAFPANACPSRLAPNIRAMVRMPSTAALLSSIKAEMGINIT